MSFRGGLSGAKSGWKPSCISTGNRQIRLKCLFRRSVGGFGTVRAFCLVREIDDCCLSNIFLRQS